LWSSSENVREILGELEEAETIMGGKWRRVCCACNGVIEGKAKKIGRCGNDSTVFWVHRYCESYLKWQRRLKT
jgi:hypothetical protein